MLRNAFYLFADQGYDKATMRALAAACGVSPALLTHMFQTKENLWYEAVDAIYGPIHARQVTEIRALESEPVDFQRFQLYPLICKFAIRRQGSSIFSVFSYSP